MFGGSNRKHCFDRDFFTEKDILFGGIFLYDSM